MQEALRFQAVDGEPVDRADIVVQARQLRRAPEAAARGLSLTIRGLRKAFGDNEVLRGIDLHIPAGQFTVIVGPNACGKSTLLKLVAGSTEPDDGAVAIGGSVKMGYFAQHAMDLLDGERTVFQSLEDAFPQAGQGSLRALAGCFGFSGDDVEKKCRVLSGGEKTRLALATLVSSRANVLLLDEPTNNLDPQSREQVLDALKTYTGAVVLVTHDPGAVRALEPERVIIMPEGDEDMWSDEYMEIVELA